MGLDALFVVLLAVLAGIYGIYWLEARRAGTRPGGRDGQDSQ